MNAFSSTTAALLLCGVVALACGSVDKGAAPGSEADTKAGGGDHAGGSTSGGGSASGGRSSGGSTADIEHSSGSNSGGSMETSVDKSVCPGASPVPAGFPTCRSMADCPAQPGGSMACGPDVPSYSPRVCTQLACDADTDCVDRVCEITGCLFSRECVPKCTTTSCAAGTQCAASGHCEPISCKAGFACPDYMVCVPDRPSANPHGCGIARCDLDGLECPAGTTCDGGIIQSGNGCRVLPCNAGGTCATNFRCDASSGACSKLTCTKDSDCDCGACVNSHCEPRLFVCVPPAIGIAN